MAGAFDKLRGIQRTSQQPQQQNAPQTRVEQNSPVQNQNVNTTARRYSDARRIYQEIDARKQETISVAANRVPTGIRGFDQLVQGGFKLGSVNVLSGGPGSGKTTFAMEFLVNGALQKGEPGIYITFDETRASIHDNMKSFGWDLEKLEQDEKVIVVEYSPQQLVKILTDGGGLLDNLVSKYHAKRLVIDSISTFLMINSTEYGKRDLLMSFFKMLSKWEVTTVVTNEYTPMSGSEIGKETGSVYFETDSIIQMYYIHTSLDTDRARYIEVFKMRGTNHVTRAVPFKIDSKGIDIQLPGW